MLQQGEYFSVNSFLKDACLSHRQFDRKFLERVGVSSKQYMQIIRFDKAFRMKNRYPEKDWLTIALHCGYYDYQHPVRDYKDFTGCTPNQFLEVENQAPERTFGEKEIRKKSSSYHYTARLLAKV
jgi:transcriptional regulator GlxA family with amidase domain